MQLIFCGVNANIQGVWNIFGIFQPLLSSIQDLRKTYYYFPWPSYQKDFTFLSLIMKNILLLLSLAKLPQIYNYFSLHRFIIAFLWPTFQIIWASTKHLRERERPINAWILWIKYSFDTSLLSCRCRSISYTSCSTFPSWQIN